MRVAAGIILERLTVSGPGLTDAVLEFRDGLNVVAGASDTGKSYAFRCIDFAFGAGKSPKKIKEAAGYNLVTVQLVVRATGERFEIERSLAGGEARLKSPSGFSPDKILAAKHDAENADSLSGQLLTWSGLWGKRVRTNKRGEMRTLSFRDVARLVLVNETRLFEEAPPQFSARPSTRPVETDVLRLMVTGHESAPVIALPSKKVVASNKAKRELVEQMLLAAEAEFIQCGVTENELESEITRVEEARIAALEDFDESRENTVDLESRLAEGGQELRETQARATVVDGLQRRFSLLLEHYESDLSRLRTIEETGFLLAALPAEACPVCGSPPANHRSDACAPEYRLVDVQAAARSEMAKIESLKVDLRQMLADLELESLELERRRRNTAGLLEEARRKIDHELMPRIRQSSDTLRAQTNQRDLLLRARSTAEQLRHLRDLEASLTISETPDTPPPIVETDATAADLDAFAEEAGILLSEWNYPNPGRVVFSESEQDLVVGGQLRTDHGTGVRALTCAAFILGLARHCQRRGLPHPGLVVLDSPLLAYEEPDPDKISQEDQALRQAGIKEAFYTNLAAGSVGGQVIIFENRDPPAGLPAKFNSEHFTGNDTGRYGFFPARSR